MNTNTLNTDTLREAVALRASMARDYIVEDKDIALELDTSGVVLLGAQKSPIGVTTPALKQLLSRHGIPSKNVEAFISRGHGAKFLDVANDVIRASDGGTMVRAIEASEAGASALFARGFVSPAFDRSMDLHLVWPSIETVMSRYGLELKEARIDLDSFALQFLSTLQVEGPKVGDITKVGFQLRGGEVGNMALEAALYAFRLWCENGATHKVGVGRPMRLVHRGAREWRKGLLPQETRAHIELTGGIDRTATAYLSHKAHEEFSARIDKAASDVITGDLTGATMAAAKTLRLGEREAQALYDRMIGRVLDGDSGHRYDTSRYGLHNAVSNIANDASRSRRGELQEAAGKVLVLSPSDWKRISDADQPKPGESTLH